MLESCSVCNKKRERNHSNIHLTTENGVQINDEWYVHIHEINRDGEDILQKESTFMFCPDCSPSTTLPVKDDNQEFDIKEYMDEQKSRLDQGDF